MTPLVSVKYALPPPRPGAVVRRRLVDRLLDTGSTRLCIVVAPAGWGKTTLLAQWATSASEIRPVAWVSLDEADDEPVRFWTYVVTAVLETTGVGAPALRALSAPGVDPVSVVLPLLINELVGLTGQSVLVLDDLHVIHDHRIHEGLEFLLAYLPPSLRLVTAGRADPPLPVARQRARGDLTEIRADDLRFTSEESVALVSAVGGVELEPSVQAELWHRTEGWAAGLQLAALAAGHSDRPGYPGAGVRGDDRHVLDYLSSEVLERLEPEVRIFLVRTSVLDRLSGPLCDAVLRRSGSAEILRDLDRRNLFVVALDDRRAWFRCHGLFRDVLRSEFDAEDSSDAAVLLIRAAAWFADEGELDHAVRCRIAAGDTDAAVALLRSSEQWFFGRGAAGTYLDLGEQLVGRGVEEDAQVALMLAYAAVLSGRFDRVTSWCDVAEPLVADGGSQLDGWQSAHASVLTMRAAYGHREDAAGGPARAQAERAVELEVDPALPGYVVARAALASAHMRAERYEDAVEVLKDAWPRASRAFLPSSARLQTAGLFAMNLFWLERFEDAHQVCDEVAAEAADIETMWGEGAASSITWLRLVEGRLAYRAGEFDTSRFVLARAVDLADVWGRAADLVLVLTSLAETQLALGDRAAARAAASRAREIVDEEPVRAVAARELAALETRLGRGAARAARRVGRLHEELTDRELSILRALAGSATQREIGEALFLSVNTVKGYTKSLYRKLDATSRQVAVERGRELGLI